MPLKSNVEESKTINVTVISGQLLPSKKGKGFGGDNVNPYVKVRIRGHPDEKQNKGKTEVITGDGFNPVWNQVFNFSVKIPSLAFLEFRVKSKRSAGAVGKDYNLGAFSCPWNMVEEGYRRVTLKSYQRTNDITPASLLVHIEVIKELEN